MNYEELLENAKKDIGKYCKCCLVCDGKACMNKIPGPGAKGNSLTAIENYKAWRDIYLNMDTISENKEISIKTQLFGKELSSPIMAGPVGAVNLHYGEKYDDVSYNEILVRACNNLGTLAFTGDGTNPMVMISASKAIKANNGNGIPTIKPWAIDTIKEKIELVNNASAIAFGMDIDASGLPFLKNLVPSAGTKTADELHMIAKMTSKPFIIKGIMNVKSALKALKAEPYAIVVSNHGGRVLEDCPPTARVLKEIVEAVNRKAKVFVDGGIRSGADVFKALALGADGVLIARPFVTAVYGAMDEGVSIYYNKLCEELKEVS